MPEGFSVNVPLLLIPANKYPIMPLLQIPIKLKYQFTMTVQAGKT